MLQKLFTYLPLLLPTYLVRFSIGPLPTTLLEVILLATVVWWISTRGRIGIQDAWERAGAWRAPALLWLIAGAVSIMVSPVPLQALGLYRAYFIEPLLIFFIGLDLVRTADDRARLWKSFSGIAIALGVYALFQLVTGFGIPHPWDAWPGRRATGPFPFPNALALFVTPIAALAAARILHAEWTRWDVATVLAGFVAILCAQSDGGLVALLAAIGIAMLLQSRTRNLAIAGAVIGLIGILVIPPVRTHVAQIVLFKDWSGMVRTVMWKETVTMLTDRPLLGAGLAAYPVAIKPYHHATWMEIFQYPHNIVLNLWSETGVLGVIAFGWIVLTWVRQANNGTMEQSNRGRIVPLFHCSIAIPVLTAILVHGLVDVPYFKNDLAVAWWLLVLVTISTTTARTTER